MKSDMDEREVESLRDALRKQSLIIQKLHSELEEERDASATAADEALSMILRLQLEKADEKREANQYKILVTEQMHHAEESLVILEGINCEREKEIISLRDQVQLLKCSLLRILLNDHDLPISSKGLNKSNTFRSLCRSASRNASLPVTQLEQLCYDIGISSFPSHPICIKPASHVPRERVKNEKIHNFSCSESCRFDERHPVLENVEIRHCIEHTYYCSQAIALTKDQHSSGGNPDSCQKPIEDARLGKKLVSFKELKKSMSCFGPSSEMCVCTPKCPLPCSSIVQSGSARNHDNLTSMLLEMETNNWDRNTCLESRNCSLSSEAHKMLLYKHIPTNEDLGTHEIMSAEAENIYLDEEVVLLKDTLHHRKSMNASKMKNYVHTGQMTNPANVKEQIQKADTESFTDWCDSDRRKEKLTCVNLMFEQLNNILMHIRSSMFKFHNPQNVSLVEVLTFD